MTQKQLHGLVDCLANVCTFDTTRDYSLSIQETSYGCYYNAKLLVFYNGPYTSFYGSDLQQLLGLAEVWNATLLLISLHGVPVVKFM